MSSSLKGVMARFSGLGRGIWRRRCWVTIPSATAHVQSAESAMWMPALAQLRGLRIVLLDSPLTGRLATPLGARGVERSPRKPRIWSAVMPANGTSFDSAPLLLAAQDRPGKLETFGTRWYNQPQCAG